MSLTMYRNGSVYSTVDPLATAMLVDGDTIAWVGSEHAATSLLDSRMKVVDLEGTLVTPGFVDSHVHVTETGLALGSVDLSESNSAVQLLDQLAATAKTAVGGILQGHNWDDSRWIDQTLPTPAELDRAAGGREVYLARIDVHSGLVSAALASRLSLKDRFAWNGQNPITAEAHAAVRDAARELSDSQRDIVQRRALSHAAANGYVALAEMAAPHVGSPADLRNLAALSSSTSEHFPEVLPYWGQLVSSAEEAKNVIDSLGTPILGLAGDLNIDGSLGSHSALLRAPYTDEAGKSGSQFLTPEQVGNHLAAVSELGVTGGFHVIGDAGMDIALEGLALAEKQVGLERLRSLGHRLEHAEMVDSAAMEVLAHYAVTLSVQPMFDAYWGGSKGMYAQRLGSERALAMNPLARFYDAGIPLCFGSDAPVTPMSPWHSVRAALGHHVSDYRISARAAFIGHTRGGWRAAAGSDPLLGQLGPGAPASFAIWEIDELMVQVADERVQSWSTDPRARTPLLPALDTANDPRCLQTVHRGHELYSAPDFS